MDIRIQNIFREVIRDDNSFQGTGSVLGSLFALNKYSLSEMRDAYHSGIKLGIEHGLNKASLEGQRIELYSNTSEGKNKEFLEKFYKLAEEYKCAIQYHPEVGMVVLDRFI